MPRFQLATLGIGVVLDGEGRGLVNTPFTISAPLYAAATGGTLLTTPQKVTGVSGLAPGWLDPDTDEGSHTISYGGGTALTFNLGGANTKPATSPRTLIQYVSENGGNDANDGLSWGTAKNEIGPAIAALPDGGTVYVAPGSYSPASTIFLNGHAIVNAGAPHGGSGTNAKVTVSHTFNGNLFEFASGGLSGAGGTLRGLYLDQGGDFTGAAIAATATASARVTGIYLDDLRISGGVHGFTRDLDLDGSADDTAGGPGIRSVFVTNCLFFGCKTAGETVRLNRVVHAHFSNVNIIQAPEAAVTQGLKVLHVDSDDILWLGYVIGNVSVAAAGGNAFWIGGPGISGSLTYETGSANCHAECRVSGTATNNGNQTSSQLPFRNNTFALPVSFASEILPNRIRLVERAAIGNPAADSMVIWAQDNGSGKTQLMARFPTGAAIQIAIEP